MPRRTPRRRLALVLAVTGGLLGVVGASPGPAVAATASSLDECAVQDARLEWGFKESFRAYVSGSIASGEWQAAEGATYATPSFTFGEGSGVLVSGSAQGELLFAGSIRFTGHGGILDTTVSTPRVALTDAASGRLVLDVVGTTQAGEEVAAVAVEFAALDLAAATRAVEDGVLSIGGISATLTESGAAAFGTYPAGEPLDPITIVAPLDAACAADVEAELDTLSGQTSGGSVLWLWGILAAFALLAVAAVVTARRRQRRTP